MLNFNEKKEVKMYQLAIGAMVVNMSESDTQTIIDRILELGYEFKQSKPQPHQASKKPDEKVSQPTSALKSANKVSAEKAEKKHNDKIKRSGIEVFGDKDITITKDGDTYRLYLHCTKARNPENTGWKREALKSEFKEFGFKWAGNHGFRDYHWDTDNKVAFDNYVKHYLDRKAEYKRTQLETQDALDVR